MDIIVHNVFPGVLEQGTEPAIAPNEQVGDLHGFLCHRCMNACVNVMHKHCKAPWIKALYECTIYHLFYLWCNERTMACVMWRCNEISFLAQCSDEKPSAPC